MIRYAVISVLVMACAATALANVLPESAFTQAPHSKITYARTASVTKASPTRLKLQKCALEDCSDTPQ